MVVAKSVAEAPSCPAALIVAEFEIVPSGLPSTLTWNTTVLVEVAAMLPPAVPFAPVPRRTRMVRDAAMYSPWSSPLASVFVPVFAPVVTWIEPETKVTPVGSTSVSTTPVPES